MRMEILHISENGRYFEKADGSPFVWIDLRGVMEGTVYQAWFDPKNGQLTETAACTLPDPDAILTVRNSLEEDRLLILADEAAKISVPQRTYFETRSEEEARKVFEW